MLSHDNFDTNTLNLAVIVFMIRKQSHHASDTHTYTHTNNHALTESPPQGKVTATISAPHPSNRHQFPRGGYPGDWRFSATWGI